jgi:hypothetical protein
MTHEEREAEAQRLMAILQGDAEAGLIDERGRIADVEPVVDNDGPPICCVCDARLDVGEIDHRYDENWTVCLDCGPEFEDLIARQVVCPGCQGKCLVFRGPGQGWHSCQICLGSGWINGVVARWNDLI